MHLQRVAVGKTQRLHTSSTKFSQFLETSLQFKRCVSSCFTLSLGCRSFCIVLAIHRLRFLCLPLRTTTGILRKQRGPPFSFKRGRGSTRNFLKSKLVLQEVSEKTKNRFTRYSFWTFLCTTLWKTHESISPGTVASVMEPTPAEIRPP
jgi:hypothetical protein